MGKQNKRQYSIQKLKPGMDKITKIAIKFFKAIFIRKKDYCK